LSPIRHDAARLLSLRTSVSARGRTSHWCILEFRKSRVHLQPRP
jgi:hypothetical protein